MHHDPRSIPLCIQHHIQLTSLSFQVSQPSHSWVTTISIFLPWKSKVKIMGGVKVWSHNVSLTFYRLTSLSFHVNRPSHSWDTTFSKFDLQNPRSSGWSQSWKSQSVCNILSTHILFVPCQSALPLLRYSIFKFDLENHRSRSWVRETLKVTTWVQHSIDSHSFHSVSIGHPIPEIQLFQNLTLKIKGQGHGWGERWKSQSGCNILSIQMAFVPCQSALPFLRYSIFKIWPWKS